MCSISMSFHSAGSFAVVGVDSEDGERVLQSLEDGLKKKKMEDAKVKEDQKDQEEKDSGEEEGEKVENDKETLRDEKGEEEEKGVLEESDDEDAAALAMALQLSMSVNDPVEAETDDSDDDDAAALAAALSLSRQLSTSIDTEKETNVLPDDKEGEELETEVGGEDAPKEDMGHEQDQPSASELATLWVRSTSKLRQCGCFLDYGAAHLSSAFSC